MLDKKTKHNTLIFKTMKYFILSFMLGISISISANRMFSIDQYFSGRSEITVSNQFSEYCNDIYIEPGTPRSELKNILQDYEITNYENSVITYKEKGFGNSIIKVSLYTKSYTNENGYRTSAQCVNKVTYTQSTTGLKLISYEIDKVIAEFNSYQIPYIIIDEISGYRFYDRWYKTAMCCVHIKNDYLTIYPIEFYDSILTETNKKAKKSKNYYDSCVQVYDSLNSTLQYFKLSLDSISHMIEDYKEIVILDTDVKKLNQVSSIYFEDGNSCFSEIKERATEVGSKCISHPLISISESTGAISGSLRIYCKLHYKDQYDFSNVHTCLNLPYYFWWGDSFGGLHNSLNKIYNFYVKPTDLLDSLYADLRKSGIPDTFEINNYFVNDRPIKVNSLPQKWELRLNLDYYKLTFSEYIYNYERNKDKYYQHLVYTDKKLYRKYASSRNKISSYEKFYIEQTSKKSNSKKPTKNIEDERRILINTFN